MTHKYYGGLDWEKHSECVAAGLFIETRLALMETSVEHLLVFLIPQRDY